MWYIPPMLLAGDIGGTKTLLGLFQPGGDRPEPVVVRRYTTLDFDSLDAMIAGFLKEAGHRQLDAACFGVAGPVVGGTARLTNVPWRISADETQERFGIAQVRLLNDLQAMGYSVAVLRDEELAVLQEGDASPDGNGAIIAAGTGLGEALLHNIDGRFVPASSEGGHADYAPRTDREIALLRELVRLHGRAQNEMVLSGPGIVNIHRFLHPHGCPVVQSTELDEADAPAEITTAALERRCPQCVETLDLFVGAYGAEAGNLALRSLATAGVYVGGGIAPKILPALKAGGFVDAFRDKDPMRDLLAAVPVKIILNPRAGLLGAATHAADIANA
ncbi:MAG: glucokinase [Acidobacteriota bacterium]|nr:glucokinase [Acidobacteriota bacterium]